MAPFGVPVINGVGLTYWQAVEKFPGDELDMQPSHQADVTLEQPNRFKLLRQGKPPILESLHS